MPFSPETQKNNYFLFNWLNDQVPVFKRFTKNIVHFADWAYYSCNYIN